jgi:hypothetical protein
VNDLMAEFEARAMERHAADVARGLHDDACEYGKRLSNGTRLLLCHCSKRRREAKGFTAPPREDLYFPPPDCPRCDGDLDHDGDSWNCYECSLSWESNGSGSSCHFTDDYGDITPAVVQGDEHQAPASCCDGYGQVHHGEGALSYVTLCRNRECLERGVAAWTDPQHETPASGETEGRQR